MKRFSQVDGMDELPDAIVQYILNHINHARDVASCSCVSKRWKESVPCIKSLYFPRSVFDNSRVDLDAALSRMICSVECLEELTVYCPFSSASLAHWLSAKGGQLRHLEVRMDTLSEAVTTGDGTPSKIDCVGLGTGLESLVMWGLSMTSSPNWGVFHKLNSLQITAARLKDDALADAIRMCPNLKHLALLGCDGLHFVSIELPQLEECRLDFYGKGDCSLNLGSPKLNSLEVDGCGWVQVKENHCLRNLTISNNEGKVCRVEFGKLPCLEFLTVRGVQWTWTAMSSILQIATEVKHLVMKVEFTGDYDQLEPFPVIDMVGFFNCHPKLQTFGIHGAMFAALSQKDSLKNLDSKFSIPSLEEVMITVRSSLNAEQKMGTLESLLRHSSRLKKMVVRVSQMKNCHIGADEFFEEVCKFRSHNYKTVRVE